MKEQYSRIDFLEALFAEYFQRVGNFIFVRGTSDLNLLGAAKFYPNIESLAAAKMPDDQHILFGVCPRERMKPGRENIRYITALWAGVDLEPEGYSGRSGGFADFDALMDAVKRFPLVPSIMVQSGRGMHIYWLLRKVTELTDPDKIDALLGTIGRYFQCHAETGIHATMRLPGTANPKYPAARCVVTHMDRQIVYTLADFDNLKLPDVAAPRKRPSVASMAASRSAPSAPPVPATSEVKAVLRRPAASGRNSWAGKPAQPQTVMAEKADIAPDIALANKIDDRVLDSLAERIAEKVADRVAASLADKISGIATEKAFLNVMEWLAGSARDAIRASQNHNRNDREGNT